MLPPRPKFQSFMEDEIEEKFLHGGRGAGGQKINKCNSKVQLKHVPTGIIVSCQETRSRDQNRKLARDKLALALERHKSGGTSSNWVPTVREAALNERARQQKRSKERKSRAKYDSVKTAKEKEERERAEEEEQILRSLE